MGLWLQICLFACCLDAWALRFGAYFQAELLILGQRSIYSSYLGHKSYNFLRNAILLMGCNLNGYEINIR